MYLLQFCPWWETLWRAEGQLCTGTEYPAPHPLNTKKKQMNGGYNAVKLNIQIMLGSESCSDAVRCYNLIKFFSSVLHTKMETSSLSKSKTEYFRGWGLLECRGCSKRPCPANWTELLQANSDFSLTRNLEKNWVGKKWQKVIFRIE